MRGAARSSIALTVILAVVLTPALPAAATLGGWSTPITLSAAGQGAFDSQVVTDGTTITAIWRRFDGNYRIQAASSVNGGATFSTPVSISATGQDAAEPQLVTDGTTITAIWTRFDGTNDVIQSAYSTNGGTTFSSPVTISGAGQNASAPQLVTSGSIVTAVWTRFDGTNTIVQSASSTSGSGTFGSPVDLSVAGQDATAPQLATDGSTIIAVWSRNDGSTPVVQAAHSTNAGTSFTAPVTVSEAGHFAGQPQVVTLDGTITAIWQHWDGSHLRIQSASSTNNGADWSTPVMVSEAGNSARQQQLVTNGTTITAIWTREDGINHIIQSAVSSNGGITFTAPVNVSGTGQSAGNPQLATAGTRVVAVWSRSDGSTERIQASTLAHAPIVSRLSGADRYETAVAISSEFATGVPVVYLATGTNYPDALSAASAAAFQEGPLLLTTPSSLPTVIRNELVRLDPDLVVIVGGTGVVSASVEAAVGALLPGAQVRRDAGANRYETSRVIADEAFSGGAFRAYIATGANFPDALSASAAAGVTESPVILVNGNASRLDSATTALLTSLSVQEVVIAGGTAVVSSGIEGDLKALLGVEDVTRLSGADRYATSLAVNAATFATSDRVFMATGLNYPDALAGAALAGHVGAPLFVVPRSCVPAAMLDELAALGTANVSLLGGTGVLTAGVRNLTSC